MMHDLAFIETQLQSPSLKRRTDFIATYDFPEQYNAFYRDYIRRNLQNPPRDSWFLIALIELAEDIHFFEPDIPTLLWQLYDSRRTAVYLKLTVLDYFLAYPVVSGESAEWEKNYRKRLQKATNELIKCQLLVNLLKINLLKEPYWHKLLTVVGRTSDYRVIIRTLNSLQKLPDLLPIHRKNLTAVVRENPLSQFRAVTDALLKFEAY
ncbi:hypothetical protein [Rhodoflexus caldus]|uniref:hypothetical protein n=1 Tax=Rhodoflexus caldus TaxID=2891236 RepID=UPI00202A4741|nr:hypothetical protein [Rhodoflexus caldus]